MSHPLFSAFFAYSASLFWLAINSYTQVIPTDSDLRARFNNDQHPLKVNTILCTLYTVGCR